MNSMMKFQGQSLNKEGFTISVPNFRNSFMRYFFSKFYTRDSVQDLGITSKREKYHCQNDILTILTKL